MKLIFDNKSLNLFILGVISLLAIISLFLMFSKAGLTGRQTDESSFLPNYQPGESVYSGVNEDFEPPAVATGPPKCCVNTQTGAFIIIPRKSLTDVPICPASHNGDTGFPLDCEKHTASFRPAQPSLPPQQFTSWTPTPTYQSADSTYGSVTSVTPQPQPTISTSQPSLPAPTNDLSSTQGQLPASPLQPQLPTQPSVTSQPSTPEPITNVPVIGKSCDFIQLSSQNMAVRQVCDNSDLVIMMCSPGLAFSSGNWNELRRETCAKGCEIVNDNAECKRPAIILSDLQACGPGGMINKYYGDYVSAEDCVTNQWGTRFGGLLVWDEYNNEWREGPSGVFGASNSCSDSSNIKISYCGSTLVGNSQAKYVCIKKESCRSGTKCKQRDLTPAEIGTQGCMMHFSGGRCTVSECS